MIYKYRGRLIATDGKKVKTPCDKCKSTPSSTHLLLKEDKNFLTLCRQCLDEIRNQVDFSR